MNLYLSPDATYAGNTGFRAKPTAGADTGGAMEALADAGLLQPGEDERYTIKKRIDGVRPRVLHLKLDRLFDFGDGDI